MYDTHESGGRRRVAIWATVILLVAVAGLLLVRITLGRYVLEKLLTQLAMPCGLIWLGLACGCVIVWGQKLARSLLVALFLLLSVAGNEMLGDWLMTTLESRFSPGLSARTPSLELLVILGGGSARLNSGEAQLNQPGDRVALAVRWFRKGGTPKHLVATGAATTSSGFDPLGGAKATAEIWRELGVPASAITIIGGRNTAEEIQELKSLLANRSERRVGLVTSAWHLPRAMRLARKAGLDLVPVAADFQTRRPRGSVPPLLPTAEGLQKTSLATKEYLAYLVSR